MNISITDALKAWAEQRVADGRYASTSDYVRDLIRKDQDAAEELAWLQREVEKGLASPMDSRAPTDIIEAVIARNRNKYG